MAADFLPHVPKLLAVVATSSATEGTVVPFVVFSGSIMSWLVLTVGHSPASPYGLKWHNLDNRMFPDSGPLQLMVKRKKVVILPLLYNIFFSDKKNEGKDRKYGRAANKMGNYLASLPKVHLKVHT